MDGITQRQMQTACMFPENREEGACPVKITKLAEFVDSKADRSSNTDSQNTPTQHQLSSVTDSWMPEDKSTEWTV